MDRKQVIVISLLIIAVILSSASVIMDLVVIKNIQINEQSPKPTNGNIEFSISTPTEIENGENNGI